MAAVLKLGSTLSELFSTASAATACCLDKKKKSQNSPTNQSATEEKLAQLLRSMIRCS